MDTTSIISTTLAAGVVDAAANEEANFEAATTVAQIFSGIVFLGLGTWLLISNGTKMSYIQRASLEKRMMTCCSIDTYVALFSAFFNFFQLTEVDDLFLPRPGGFTLDFARPIEWIVTCPMMQVVLVLMGGSRIPEYRRMLMPGLSLAVLVCGTTSMLLGSSIRFAFYAVGFTIAMGMFFLNAKQVQEHSNGEENLWVGDSEFRKASILLIVTWFPFPLWFFVSPEGVGIIDNVLIIQMGWAFLNILSKFTFIFYIQRVKDSYCNRLKVRRELLGNGHSSGADSQVEALAGMLGISKNNPFAGGVEKSKEKELAAVVIETMTFLGMAQHNDRFLKLLKDAKVTTVPMVEALKKEESDELQLPWDLVSALQKRIKVWRMEMTDNAEMELEKGEAHYQAATPVKDFSALLPGQVQGEQEDGSDMRSAIARALMGNNDRQPTYSAEFQEGMQHQLAMMQEMMSRLEQQAEQISSMQMRRQTEMEGNIQWQLEQLVERNRTGDSERVEQLIANCQERNEQAVDALGRTVAAKLESLFATERRYHAENEANFLSKMSAVVQKQSEQTGDALSNSIQAKLDSAQAAQYRQTNELSDSIVRNLEGAVSRGASRSGGGGHAADGDLQAKLDSQQRALDRLDANLQKALERSDTNGEILSLKIDKVETNLMQGVLGQNRSSGGGSDTPRSPTNGSAEMERTLQSRIEDLQSAQMRQLEDHMSRKFEDVIDQAITRFEISLGNIRSTVQGDVNSLARGSDLVAETVRATGDTHLEGLADLRRVNMMILEQSSAALEKGNNSMGKMDVLQGALDSGIGRLYERLDQMASAGGVGGALGGMSLPQDLGGAHSRPVSARHAGGGQWPTQSGHGSHPESRRGSSDMRSSMSSRYGMQVING